MKMLTKETALKYLNNIAPENRDLNFQKVYEYRDRINAGDVETIPAIEIESGKITNGQHRLMAFVLSVRQSLNIKINFKNETDC